MIQKFSPMDLIVIDCWQLKKPFTGLDGLTVTRAVANG